MSIYPESQLGIWLNTPIKFLDTTAQRNLRAARNDPQWNTAANDAWSPVPVTAENPLADEITGVGYLTMSSERQCGGRWNAIKRCLGDWTLLRLGGLFLTRLMTRVKV